MRRHASRRITALILGALAAAALSPLDVNATDPRLVATFRPADDRALAGLEMAWTDRARGGHHRVPVTDILIRLRSADEGRIDTLLGLPDGERAGRGRALFTVEMIVVAGGRLVVEEQARCAPWVAGAALCRTECDGGVFALLRGVSGGARSLTLRVGRVEADDEAGVRLAGCADADHRGEAMLKPRAGSSVAEIPLRRD